MSLASASLPQSVAFDTNANSTLVNAINSTRITVLGFLVSTAGAVNVQFRTNATGIGPLMRFGAASPPIAFQPNVPMFSTNAGEPLNLNLSAATLTSGTVIYVTQP